MPSDKRKRPAARIEQLEISRIFSYVVLNMFGGGQTVAHLHEIGPPLRPRK